MAEDTTIQDALKSNAAAGIASARGDEGEVVAMDPLKQIEVDKYLKSSAAGKGRRLGVRFTRMIPPAATGPRSC